MDGNRGPGGGLRTSASEWHAHQFHTGTSIFPGARNLHAQPMLCDDVSNRLSESGGHSCAWRQAIVDERSFFPGPSPQNMYMDISGIPPRN